MSPLRGGASGKAGDVYEAYCGVEAMLQVLGGDAESIRIEVPGIDKAKFVLNRPDGTKEYWQAKRNVSGQKDWSLQRLASEGILNAFLMNSAKGESLFFLSTSDAQDLRILSECAQNSHSFDEFESIFLQQNVEHPQTFNSFCDVLGITAKSKAYEYLRTIKVRVWDKDSIRSHVIAFLGTWYENAEMAFDILAQYYFEQIHQTLDRGKIREHLKARGVVEQVGIYSPTLKESILSVTNKFISSRERNLIHQRLIRRNEGENLVKMLCESEDHSTHLVMSQAGSGKSAFLYQLSNDLVEQNVPVLAFSMDWIHSASTARQLGEKLDLPNSPTITLCNASENSPLVIIIDQVDYLSRMSGRDNGLFEALYDLLKEVENLRLFQKKKIRLVLACRRFDYEYDRDLNRLLRESSKIQLEGLLEEDIQHVLDEDGFSLSTLKQPQIELLKVPQNLHLFIASSASKVGNTRFQTQKDLFDIFWDEKRKKIDGETGQSGDEWIKAIRIMCEQMSKSQRLTVPEESLDSINLVYRNRMASEGVLVRQEGSFSFQHESFFDYCHARILVGDNSCFISVLEQDSEQNFFRRTQLRQYMTYLRERKHGFDDYLDKMKKLVHSNKIRFHLKQLAIQLIGEWSHPRKEEWEMICPFIQMHIGKVANGMTINRNGLERTSFFTMHQSYLADLPEVEGFILQLLTSKNAEKEKIAINYLRIQAENDPEKSIEMLEPHVSNAGHWPDSLSWFCYSVRGFTEEPCMFEFYIRLLERGIFDSFILKDDKDHSDITHLLAHQQFIHYFEEKLKRLLVNAPEEITSHLCSPLEGGHSSSILIEAAESMPEFFLERILPLVFLLGNAYKAKAKRESPDNEFHDDLFWHPLGFGLELTTIFNGKEQESESSRRIVNDNEGVIKAIQKALILVGKKSIENLCPFIQELKSYHLYVSNYILVNIYLTFLEHFAEEAMQLCAKEPGRVYCGNWQNAYRHGGALLQSCSILCTEKTFDKLESNLLDYYDKEDKRYGEYHENSRRVISYLDATRIKDSTKELSEQWERQFQQRIESRRSQHSPVDDAMYFGRPIDLTNDEYYEAALKYDDPEEMKKHDFRLLLKNNVIGSERLVRLALNAPEHTVPLLYSAVFFALYDHKIQEDHAFALIRKIIPLNSPNLNHDGIFFLGRQELNHLPDDIVEFILHVSLTSVSPKEIIDDDERDILTTGMNTPRGGAICYLGKMLEDDPSIAQRYPRQIKSIIKIDSPSVSSCIPSLLGHLLNIDRGYWLDVVEDYYSCLDERVFSTSWNKQLFRELIGRYPSRFVHFIDQLLESKYAMSRKQGGKHAVVARFYIGDSIEIFNIAQTDDRIVQLGIAESLWKLIHHSKTVEWIQPLLRLFFNSEDENIRKAASSSLSRVEKNGEIGLYRGIVEDFIDSPAFFENIEHLWEFQKKFAFFPSDLTLRLCKSYLDAAKNTTDDKRHKHWIGDKIGKMAFRAYSSSSMPERVQFLDVIDEMMCTGLFGAEKHIENFERD